MKSLEWNIEEPGSWQLDSGHFPVPLTRYFQPILRDEFPRGFGEGSRKIGLLLSHFDHTFVNGFDYNCARPVGAPKNAKGPPPFVVFKLLCWFHPEFRARLRTASTTFERKAWREDLALWQVEVRPSSTKTHLELQSVDPTHLDDRGLASHLELLRKMPGTNTTCTTASRSARSRQWETSSHTRKSGRGSAPGSSCKLAGSRKASRP